MTPSQATLTENGRHGDLQALPTVDEQLVDVLAHFPGVMLAVLFGSVALGRQRPDSDLDIAVAARSILEAWAPSCRRSRTQSTWSRRPGSR
ncbi:MAG: nucleotidyltransferase domain-containing protein, partial [Burkholderiales bacterium]|nr:nucleotidyltransferase domain-containing protein [Burkholderiales bacterium]